MEATNCSYDDDYLEFHDGKMQNVTNATRIGRYCGWTYPTPNLTDALTQQYLTLVWRTNGYNEDKGWKVMATRVLPCKCTQQVYSKNCLERPLKIRPKIGFQDRLSHNAGQKYYRMLPLEHSAILSTFIELPFVIKLFVLSIFE